MRHAHRSPKGSPLPRHPEGRLTDTRDTGPLLRNGDAALAGLDLFSWAHDAGRKPAAPAPQNPCSAPADPPPEALRIHGVLYRCICRRNALTAPRIAAEAGLWPDLRDADRGTKVRELITLWYETLLTPGRVLVSDSCGYWHTHDAEEISHYCQQLRSRGREIFVRERRIRMAAKTAGFVHHGGGNFSRT